MSEPRTPATEAGRRLEQANHLSLENGGGMNRAVLRASILAIEAEAQRSAPGERLDSPYPDAHLAGRCMWCYYPEPDGHDERCAWAQANDRDVLSEVDEGRLDIATARQILGLPR